MEEYNNALSSVVNKINDSIAIHPTGKYYYFPTSDIVRFIGDQFMRFSVKPSTFVDYIILKLDDCSSLNIFARGCKTLDNSHEDNLYSVLKFLRDELNNYPQNSKNDKRKCKKICYQYASILTADESDDNNNPQATTDFSHLRSFTPKINFDSQSLYNCLMNEGVIKNIDKDLFDNCISHAHLNELFVDGKQAKIKCVIHHLKNHYCTEWHDYVCQHLGKTKREMGKFNLGSPSNRVNFEKKLNMIR